MEKNGYALLFHPITAVLIYYFWFNRKQIGTNDIFIGVNYVLLIGAFIMADLPTTPLGRVFYLLSTGLSVLFAKLVLKDKQHGFLFLVYIILFMFYSNIKHGGGNLSLLLGGDYLNPAYGLANMVYNIDKFVLPSALF